MFFILADDDGIDGEIFEKKLKLGFFKDSSDIFDAIDGSVIGFEILIWSEVCDEESLIVHFFG